MGTGSGKKDRLEFWFEKGQLKLHVYWGRGAKGLKMVRVFEIIEAEPEPGIAESPEAEGEAHMSS